MPKRRLLLDTGPLVALFDQKDKLHPAAKRFFSTVDAKFFTTWPVITEVCHFIPYRNHSGLLRAVSSGLFTVVGFDDGVERITDLSVKYSDQEADFADLSLIFAAEKVGIVEIVTVDVTDFSVYRISGRKRFTVVPI